MRVRPWDSRDHAPGRVLTWWLRATLAETCAGRRACWHGSAPSRPELDAQPFFGRFVARQRALANAFGAVVSRVEAVTAGAAASLTGGGGGSGIVGGTLGGGGGGGGDGAGVGAGGLSTEAVDNLSKRLTTAEMRSILQLTERSRRLEARAGSLQAEKEDLFARLQVGAASERVACVGRMRCLARCPSNWFGCDSGGVRPWVAAGPTPAMCTWRGWKPSPTLWD